jgi:hypothetical protein
VGIAVSQKPEQLGRIIRGEIEETWSLVIDDGGSVVVRYEAIKVTGDERKVAYLSPESLYASNAPEPIKDRLLERGLIVK